MVFFAVLLWAGLLASLPLRALADSDETVTPVDPTAVGTQPLTGPVATATPSPGESALTRRADGTFAAVPTLGDGAATFHLVAREAPWTLRPGLVVMARTYNGVVPGPTLVVRQGQRVVIDFRNALPVADTIHLHGIHGASDAMDGVAGISQPMVAPGGTFRYTFVAAQSGTFIYHTHDDEQMLNSGLYGAIVVLPAHPRPEERVQRDDVEMLSSWSIQSNAENHFTINGKEYPATTPIEVRKGDRVRLRWINISAENVHTMHTHGHDQLVIARDAQPVATRDLEDTVLLGPGQRVDTVVVADQQPGNWLVHCHVLDHVQDGMGMPAGLVTTIHYAGTPNKLAAMGAAMATAMRGNGAGASAGTPPRALSFGATALLGAFAGLTIFLGLPVARARRLSPGTIAALNALAIGILVYLVVEIAGNATSPLLRAVVAWRHGAPAPVASVVAYVAGLLVGIGGLGVVATRLTKHATGQGLAEKPLLLAAMIAIGIGAHNFAEGLAIGASAAAGATAIAFALILGFALHNATEGFGIAAPIAGRGITPSWGQLALAGLIAGGPTFLGAMIGYRFSSPTLATFFLTTAVGALVFVIGELWTVLRRSGLTIRASAMLAAGFVLALGTEAFIDLAGG
ncbi:MAG TPA: multicopper oxidase domain-containing protein [Candidatus Limnocylindria bacterium]|nr:multicopper oxidase domain-containing protein [Candidatus Limnocylindria bacterium]